MIPKLPFSPSLLFLKTDYRVLNWLQILYTYTLGVGGEKHIFRTSLNVCQLSISLYQSSLFYFKGGQHFSTSSLFLFYLKNVFSLLLFFKYLVIFYLFFKTLFWYPFSIYSKFLPLTEACLLLRKKTGFYFHHSMISQLDSQLFENSSILLFKRQYFYVSNESMVSSSKKWTKITHCYMQNDRVD